MPALKFHEGIAGNKLLGFYFLQPRLNGAIYHDFLRNFLTELLQDMDLQTGMHLWFMLDGAQPHFLLAFRKFSNNALPGQSMGRRKSAPSLIENRFIFMSGKR